MKRVLLVQATAVLAFLLCLGPALAQETQLPCRFHGTVLVNGEEVRQKTIITATIGEDMYCTSTPSVYGESTYLLQIVPPRREGYSEMTKVIFRINGQAADQTGYWEIGGNRELNLTAGGPALPPPEEPQYTWAIVGTIFGVLFAELVAYLLWRYYVSARSKESGGAEESEPQSGTPLC